MKRWLPLLLIFVSATAFAADPNMALGLNTKLMGRFAEVLSEFETVIRSAGLKLFVVLLLIENSVWAIKQVVNDSLDMGGLALKLAWNFIVWGFFGLLIKDSHHIMSSIIDTFFKLGQDATGLGGLDATRLLATGIDTTLAMFANADVGVFSVFDKPLILLTALIAVVLLLAAFVVAAAQLVMAQVEAMIVIAAAPILLAFGALSYTRDIATKVLSHALGTGVKILTIYIIAGVMAKIGPDFAAILKANGAQIFSSPGQLLEVIAVAGLMVILAFFVPSIASAMLSGSASLSGGAAIGGAMGAAAAGAGIGAAGIGALTSGGGKLGAATNVAAGANGITQAVGAGYSSGADLGLGKREASAHSVGEGATGTSHPNYVPPPTDTGNAAGASISGSGAVPAEPPRSTLGKIANAAAGALNATQSTLSSGREHVIDDRVQVGAQIDTKVSH